MKPAEFEEKEYEGFLCNQLQVGPHRLWSPGQVLEAYLGFDHGLFLDDPFLWDLYGIRRPYPGLSLARLRFLRHTHGDDLVKRMPTFRMNCFLQAKRPEVGVRMPKTLASLGKGRPYFKIAIDADQQKTIDAVAGQMKGRGLFVYAAPVFGESRQLFANATAGTIVQQSTFPDAAKLSGHVAFYYNAPGNYGVVNQGFDGVEFASFEERIERLRAEEVSESERGMSRSEILANLQREVRTAVVITSEAGDRPRNAYLAEEWRRIDRIAEINQLPPALASYLYVEAFVRFFNLLWLVIG